MARRLRAGAGSGGYGGCGVSADQAGGAATHINDGLKQLAAETADLPVGAVVLLSDGAGELGGGIGGGHDLNALRNRRLPVHTIGFGKEQARDDVEMDDVSVASRAMADSRMAATVSFISAGMRGARRRWWCGMATRCWRRRR